MLTLSTYLCTTEFEFETETDFEFKTEFEIEIFCVNTSPCVVYICQCVSDSDSCAL